MGFPRSGLDAPESFVCADGEGDREGSTEKTLEMAANSAEQRGRKCWVEIARYQSCLMPVGRNCFLGPIPHKILKVEKNAVNSTG